MSCNYVLSKSRSESDLLNRIQTRSVVNTRAKLLNLDPNALLHDEPLILRKNNNLRENLNESVKNNKCADNLPYFVPVCQSVGGSVETLVFYSSPSKSPADIPTLGQKLKKLLSPRKSFSIARTFNTSTPTSNQSPRPEFIDKLEAKFFPRIDNSTEELTSINRHDNFTSANISLSENDKSSRDLSVFESNPSIPPSSDINSSSLPNTPPTKSSGFSADFASRLTNANNLPLITLPNTPSYFIPLTTTIDNAIIRLNEISLSARANNTRTQSLEWDNASSLTALRGTTDKRPSKALKPSTASNDLQLEQITVPLQTKILSKSVVQTDIFDPVYTATDHITEIFIKEPVQTITVRPKSIAIDSENANRGVIENFQDSLHYTDRIIDDTLSILNTSINTPSPDDSVLVHIDSFNHNNSEFFALHPSLCSQPVNFLEHSINSSSSEENIIPDTPGFISNSQDFLSNTPIPLASHSRVNSPLLIEHSAASSSSTNTIEHTVNDFCQPENLIDFQEFVTNNNNCVNNNNILLDDKQSYFSTALHSVVPFATILTSVFTVPNNDSSTKPFRLNFSPCGREHARGQLADDDCVLSEDFNRNNTRSRDRSLSPRDQDSDSGSVSLDQEFFQQLSDNSEASSPRSFAVESQNPFSDSDSSDSEFSFCDDKQKMSSHNSSALPLFKGAYGENAENFMDHFELWATTQKNLTPKAKMAYFALQMRDSARSWIKQYSFVGPAPEGEERQNQDNEIENFEELKFNFLERFKKPDDVSWQEITRLFDRPQGENEGTEAYVTEIQRRGESSGAPLSTIRMAILHGLRHQIKKAVMQHDLPSIGDIVKWGLTAENLATKGSGKSSTLDQIQKTLVEIQKNQFPGQTGTTTNPPMLPIENGADYSERQYDKNYPPQNFQNSYRGRGGRARGRPRNFSGAQNNQTFTTQQPAAQPQYTHDMAFTQTSPFYPSQQAPQFYTPPPPLAATQAYQYPNQSQPTVRSYAPNQGTSYNRQPYQNNYAQSYQPQNFRTTYQRPNYQSQQPYPCNNCGRQHLRGQCAAYGQICNNCLKFNHFANFCRSAPANSS